MKFRTQLLLTILAVAALAGASRMAAAVTYPRPAGDNAHFVAPTPQPPGIPSKVTLAGGSSATSLAVAAGACVRISCTVDCEYRVTTGAGTAVVDDNQLPAATPERFCLDNASDHITFFSASAGSAYVATTLP